MSLYKRGKSWRYNFTVDGKRYTATLGAISKTRAKEIYAKAKVAAAEGRYESSTKKKESPYLNEFVGEYFTYYEANRRPMSARRHRTSWHSIGPVLGDKRLSDITPLDLERYRRKRQDDGRSDITINRELAFLRNLFNMAIKWGRAHTNPVREVRFAQENNQRIRFLAYEEEARLLGACKEPLKPLVIAALHTGFRASELLSLTWEDVDFERRTVRVQAGYAKNGESRSVPMNEMLTRTLQEVRISHGSVFRNRTGAPYRSYRTAFNTAVRRAKIVDFTFHDLRHTFASRLVMGGIDLTTVKELMGHKDITMTLRYSHLSDEHKQRAVAILSAPIFAPREEIGNRESSEVIENKYAPVAQLG